MWLIILFACPTFAQVKQIKDAKYTKPTEIHKFDFLNSTYQAACADTTVKVRNGLYSPPNSANFYFEFKVSVSYGDLTGDKIEEAIVVTQCSGTVQNYDEGKIYTVKNHRLVQLAELEIGTKNGGDILNAQIKNNRLIVPRGPSPNLCRNTTGAAQETATYMLSNNKLRQIGFPICKPI